MPNEKRQPGRPGPDDRRRAGRERPAQPDTPTGDRPQENLVLVQFKGHRKGYYHNRRDLELRLRPAPAPSSSSSIINVQ